MRQNSIALRPTRFESFMKMEDTGNPDDHMVAHSASSFAGPLSSAGFRTRCVMQFRGRDNIAISTFRTYTNPVMPSERFDIQTPLTRADDAKSCSVREFGDLHVVGLKQFAGGMIDVRHRELIIYFRLQQG